MLRAIIISTLVATGVLGITADASAQCVTVGARICQGGYIYVCEPCGSEKCWIATSTRCLRDETPDLLDERAAAKRGGRATPADMQRRLLVQTNATSPR